QARVGPGEGDALGEDLYAVLRGVLELEDRTRGEREHLLDGHARGADLRPQQHVRAGQAALHRDTVVWIGVSVARSVPEDVLGDRRDRRPGDEQGQGGGQVVDA